MIFFLATDYGLCDHRASVMIEKVFLEIFNSRIPDIDICNQRKNFINQVLEEDAFYDITKILQSFFIADKVRKQNNLKKGLELL